MKIRGFRTLAGPNVFHHEPVLVMTLDLEELAEAHSASLPGFTERLLALIPGLTAHTCSRGYPGGFVERLREGTYPGHIIEHVALELSQQAGIGQTFGKTVSADRPDAYEVVVRFESAEGMTSLLCTAVTLFARLAAGDRDPGLPGWLEAQVQAARELAQALALGPTTRSLVEEAAARGIPWERVGEGSLVQLGWGERLRWLQASTTHLTRSIPVDIAGDKELTKTLLRRANVPVPRGAVVMTVVDAVRAMRELGAPVVIKPLDGHQGQGVSLGLRCPDEVERAFTRAREFSPRVLVEEQVEGRDYRALVVAGRLVAASERTPAHVVGDGRSSIAQLVERVNQDPRRARGHDGALTCLALDELTRAVLARSGLTPEAVPADGQVVPLRDTANLSTGGTARDVTDLVHDDVRALCERAVRVVGLDVAGVDLVLPDVARPPGRGKVIEVNAAPGLRMHHAPSEGQRREAAAAIVDTLFPPGDQGRLPLVAVTGTNGKTTVTRMIGHALQALGRVVGMTTTTDVRVGERVIDRGDCSGPASARSVLCDPAVQVAVLETARGGILRGGLAYDWSDVAVLTNVQLDHVGQGGIESLEDILHIKSLVAERVRAGGAVVLNADDPNLAGLMDHPRMRRVPGRRAVFFSLEPDGRVVREHLRAGGTAFVLQDGWLVEATGPRAERLVAAADLPVTLGATAAFQVQNALAALAAVRALGVAAADAVAALRGFDAQHANPGRTELFRVRDATVVVDYGHNPEAFRAVAAMVGRWPASRTTCVVGCPGDRADWLICEGGRVAGGAFERVIVKEDADLRGRTPGEVARLLCDAIRVEAPGCRCEAILDEREAVERALSDLVPGEVVVVFFDDAAVVSEVLARHGAAPTSSPALLGERAVARR